MQETGNYKLKKPEGTDIVNIEDLNANSDIIDRELANKAQKEHTHSNYVNQNAFSNIKVGSTTIAADSTTDILTIAAGNNVTLTPDAANDKITISSANTVYTHPTTSGNKHIPSGGSSGQVLKWSADGTAAWGVEKDTVYTHPTHPSKTSGLYKVTIDGTGHVSAATAVTKADITNLGIPAQDTNTTYGVATASTLGLVKSGTDITVDSSGNVSVVDDSHNHVISNVDGLQTALNGKAASSHTHQNYMNQNAFSNIKVGSATLAASNTTATLTLEAGSNVTLTPYLSPDSVNDKVVISATDTKYTHPTTSGNKHIPSGGSSGQILKWNANGTATWEDEKDTTYTHPSFTSVPLALCKIQTQNGHVSKTETVTKEDITKFGIASSDSPVFTNNISMGRRAGTTVGLNSIALGSYATASGSNSVALGNFVTASGNFSHAEGASTTASESNSHAEGSMTTASGSCSHAEGYNTIASGSNSHAEGSSTEASKDFSHAEGYSTTASGSCSHAEGTNTTALGSYSHAEGDGTKALGGSSHAEGYDAIASGHTSHAEGLDTTASGNYSHVEGYHTTASNIASHVCGKYNKAMNAGGGSGDRVGDVFVVGNGTHGGSGLSNAFRITYAGEVYGTSAFQSSGADYAEYFEWLDSNTENEDRVGYFVTMKGNKIKKAESSQDYILGIVSAQPCIIGNSDEDWLGRWLHDEFGRFLKREVKTPVTEWKEVQVNSNSREEKVNFELKEIETGEYVTGWDYVPNPDYDPNQSYIERKDRKEWSAIGMMGVLAVRDDGTCKVNGFCTVKEGGIATATNERDGYRVIERVTETIVKVVFR